MPSKVTSPTRLKRLGSALRTLREATELTAEQAAKRLGWSGSKVSRIETGKQLVGPDDVRRLVGLYDVGEDEVEKYVTIARQARQRDWWHRYDDVLPDWFEGYLELEAEASEISTYESDLVPGLCRPNSTQRVCSVPSRWGPRPTRGNGRWIFAGLARRGCPMTIR